ncbi:SPOR domain-containing protein [Myroides phaeus]|uniref:Sporulation related domain-containing protein n=1 Tax=Myroides phaeus TaxID=702745 RepID=A0A1G8C0H3_9FLAO|nr:SPOR domain-containing protein [Myroides phaeus]SDH38868.1 Sporulation related domain-containing protein [Myroides phaeus]
MRILRIFIALTLILITNNTISAQSKNTVINEPVAIKELVNKKKQVNTSTIVNDKYKIQIFYGKNSDANAAISRFKRSFPSTNATIIYTNPSYKVLVGNYKTRLDAERNLKIIQKEFDNALLIYPGK